MKPIRVLHVVFAMNRGGMESRLMDIYRKIDREKVQFDFLENYSLPCDYDEEIISLGGKIYRSGYSRKNIIVALNYIKNFFEEDKEHDIIHIHESYLPSFNMAFLYYVKKNSKRKLILHSRNASGKYEKLHNILKRSHVKKFDYYFSCSEKAAHWMFTNDIIKNKNYRVINNAIDAYKFIYDQSIRQEMRKTFEIADNKIVLGHVGRFWEQKNHDFLIELFSKSYRQNANLVLLLIGVGPLQEKIKNRVKEYGLEDAVIFLDSRNDMPNMYQMFDIFLLPSLYEGLPGVGVEAQAAGLPCLFSDTITNEAGIIDGLYEFLPIDQGIEIWQGKIMSIVSKGIIRKDTYLDICKAGFDSKAVAAKLEEFYLSL